MDTALMRLKCLMNTLHTLFLSLCVMNFTLRNYSSLMTVVTIWLIISVLLYPTGQMG